mmetsp:Transcript_4316/g.9688  ORF Transcript_4316/g.9688 Transcript_4316/m.9688 type:complete len:122 (+) Transcript_4316:96-461(+)
MVIRSSSDELHASTRSMLKRMRVFSLLDTHTRTRLTGQMVGATREHPVAVVDGGDDDDAIDDAIPLDMASTNAAAVDASLMDAMFRMIPAVVADDVDDDDDAALYDAPLVDDAPATAAARA